MNRKILFVIAAIFIIAIFSGCTGKYEPQAGTSSTVKPYTIQDRGNGSYLVEPTEITTNNIPRLLSGYNEINTKCDVVFASDFVSKDGGGYYSSSSVSLLVKVRSCREKINTIN